MRVLVCGGRDYSDRESLYKELDKLDKKDLTIISGAARGADSLASEWAFDNKIDLLEFFADWAAHGRSAGPRRNIKMLNEGLPNLVLAFPGGKGTAHMVSIAREAGVTVIECK